MVQSRGEERAALPHGERSGPDGRGPGEPGPAGLLLPDVSEKAVDQNNSTINSGGIYHGEQEKSEGQLRRLRRAEHY